MKLIIAIGIAIIVAIGLILASALYGRSKNMPRENLSAATSTPKIFHSSFESIEDFSGFYIVPQNHLNGASHDKSTERVRSGTYAHKGWIYAANPPSTRLENNNHRGYPTVQLYKRPGGGFKTPALIEFWVWLDAQLSPGEWFSFATIDHTTSDSWDGVLVNLSGPKARGSKIDEGIVHLMHVPRAGASEWSFQTPSVKFPMREWVKLSICVDFTKNGETKVWQNGILVSSARTGRGNGILTQAHFGLYAPPSLANGVIYNDDLTITEGSCTLRE